MGSVALESGDGSRQKAIVIILNIESYNIHDGRQSEGEGEGGGRGKVERNEKVPKALKEKKMLEKSKAKNQLIDYNIINNCFRVSSANLLFINT